MAVQPVVARTRSHCHKSVGSPSCIVACLHHRCIIGAWLSYSESRLYCRPATVEDSVVLMAWQADEFVDQEKQLGSAEQEPTQRVLPVAPLLPLVDMFLSVDELR